MIYGTMRDSGFGEVGVGGGGVGRGDPHAGPVPSDTAEPGALLLVGYGRGSAALVGALEAEGHQVAVFSRYSSCLREAPRVLPDSILVGCDPTAGEVFPFLVDLNQVLPEVPSIALAPTREAAWTERALAAGADDIVAPPHSAASILLRRRVLLRSGRASAARGALARRVPLGPMTVDLNSRQVLDGTDPLTLSGREFELLVRLMQAAGDVVHRGELIRDIWGEEQCSDAVLDATVHRLRRKLDEKLPDRELVTTVRGVGYRLQPSPAG